MLNTIGSREDDLNSTAQRLLILMEGHAIYNQQFFSLIMTSILDHYLKYVDSVGKPLIGSNLYAYAHNEPISRIDPYGLADWHFDRAPSGERLIHSGKYRFNPEGQLVDHGGRPMQPDPCKDQSEKEMKKILKWLRGAKPDFFRFFPILIWFGGVEDQIFNNIQNGLPVNHDSYDEFGNPIS